MTENQKRLKEALNENKKHQATQLETKRNYEEDKKGWVLYKNKSRPKIKLRAFIRKRAQDLSFLDQYKNVGEAREKLIEKYNEGGVNLVDKFVDSEYLKEVDVTFQEMKELEENA